MTEVRRRDIVHCAASLVRRRIELLAWTRTSLLKRLPRRIAGSSQGSILGSAIIIVGCLPSSTLKVLVLIRALFMAAYTLGSADHAGVLNNVLERSCSKLIVEMPGEREH